MSMARQATPVHTVGLFALVALTAIVYRAALDGPFLLDDLSNLPGARPEGTGWRALLDAAGSNESGFLGRPVAALTFSLQYLFGAEGPYAFKVVNLCLHLLNSLLVAAVLYVCLRIASVTVPKDEKGYDGVVAMAWLTAVAWFTLHPLHVSTTMYVVQRMTLLSQTFGLLAVWLYLRTRTSRGWSPQRRVVVVTLAAGSSAMAAFSKENGLLVPVYVVVLEVALLRLRGPSMTHGVLSPVGLSDRGVRVGLASLFLLATAGTAAMVLSGSLDGLMMGYEAKPFTIGQRLTTQPVVMIDYLGLLLWPDPGAMSFYRDGVAAAVFPSLSTITCFVLLVALAAAGVWLSATRPLIGAGVLIYLVSHALESSVFPLEMMFEHRTYIGSFGLSLALLGALVRITHTRVLFALMVAVTLGLAILTLARSETWSNEFALNGFAVESAPDSLRAKSAYALSLSKRGQLKAAVEQLEAGAVMAPDDPYFPLEILQTKALLDTAEVVDYARASAVLSEGELDLATESVLADLLRNVEAERLSGVSPAWVSALYELAETRYARFAPAWGQATLSARAAEAHLLAGRPGEVLSSIDRAAALLPRDVVIALRRFELRAGLAPASISSAEVEEFLEGSGPFGPKRRDRLVAVVEHLRAVGTRAGEGRVVGGCSTGLSDSAPGPCSKSTLR